MPNLETPPVRRTLPHPSLIILVFATAASAQISMPEGVLLSPFPVALSPPAHVTFRDGFGGVWSVFQPDSAGGGLYSNHINDDGSYGPGGAPLAVRLAAPGTSVNGMSAAPDGLGGALVTWFGVNPKDQSSPFAALRFQHIDRSGLLMAPDTGYVVSNLATAALVASDGAGGAYVAWEENLSISNPDIVGQHFSANCAPTWAPLGSPTGRTICEVVGLQRLRAIREDGSGGAYVVWADSRTPATVPLYVARLLPGGIAGSPWPTNGLRITPVVSSVRMAGAGRNPAGGIWVAWYDLDLPNQFMGQLVSGAAAPVWGSAGALMATASPTHVDFVPAGSGDVFLTWGGTDVRCARVSPTGARVWPESDGRVLLTPPSPTGTVKVATDSLGGQWLAWSYNNAGQFDTWYLHVDGAGAPAPGEPAQGTAFAATSSSEDPEGWFLSTSGNQPILVWLEAGVMHARRLPQSDAGVGPGPTSGPLALSPPWPNPMRGSSLAVRFSAPGGPARLELFDAAGRRALVRAVYTTGGPQSLRLDEASRLAPGVYTLRLAAAGRVVSQQLVRLD